MALYWPKRLGSSTATTTATASKTQKKGTSSDEDKSNDKGSSTESDTDSEGNDVSIVPGVVGSTLARREIGVQSRNDTLTIHQVMSQRTQIRSNIGG